MMKMMIVVLVCMVCSLSQAAEIMNDGFEADTFADNGWDTSEAVDWTLSTGDWGNPGHYAWGGGGAGETENINSGRIVKDTGYVIQAGDVITLTFDIRDLTPDIEFDSAILAGMAYVDGTGEHVLGLVEYLDADIAYGWNAGQGSLTVNVTAEAVGNNLYVGFSGGPSSHNQTSAQRLGIDNVIISQVPEPATMLLFGIGGLAALRRKRA